MKQESTSCKAEGDYSINAGREQVCPAQCGVKDWCTAFTMEAIYRKGSMTYTCILFKTCAEKEKAIGTDLYRLKTRLDFHYLVI